MTKHGPSPVVLPASVIEQLRSAESVLAITGAGMSADSGLPTYRGIGGLYEEQDTDDGIPIEVALSGRMLELRPEITWKHIGRIERSCRGAGPNEGHRALAWMEEHYPRFWVLTQNVDGLHHLAGSRNVIEIHGNVHRLRCTGCGERTTVPSYAGLTFPPVCTRCGGMVRPEVVLFGEMLPRAAVQTLERELLRGFDLVLSIGTTSVFPYIAGPVEDARRLGRPTVEINPGETEVSHLVAQRIRHGAAATLTEMQRILGG